MSAPTIVPAQASSEGLRTEARDGRSLTRWLCAGALGAGAAGGLHLAVAVDHLDAGELAVGFFLLTAFAQLSLAAWLLLNSWTSSRPDRRFVTLALVGTVALMGLYVVAYTTHLLDGFVVTDASGSTAGGHGGAEHAPGIDPVTGVDLSAGVAVRPSGAVAMFGELGPVERTPGALGPWTIAAEALLVAALTALQPSTWRRRTTNGLIALGVLTWALWFTGVIA